MNSLESTYLSLLQAVSFAARAHRHQLRKDGETPYAAHPFRVCLVVCDVFGVKDPRVLTAAVLHDTIEDTTTDFDDIAEKWDAEIAGWVMLLSKDKRRPYEAREEEYCRGLAEAPWQVQVCKLADLFDNLLDNRHLPAERRQEDLKKKERYFQAVKSNLKPEAAAACDTVARLLDEIRAGRS